jgi:H+-translocating NAD(P) transhydrogenase subunit alpha
MNIGILKESPGENRVAMLPDGVAALVKLNTKVLIEKGAGENAFASDKEYEEAGASIESRSNVFSGSDILLSLAAPGKKEISKLREGKILIAILNPLVDHSLVRDLAGAGITSFSLDVIPRSTRAQAMDILSSQATISGYKAVLDAANRLGGFFQMFMSAAGTIKPAKVMVIGAGVAGLQAIASARKLGAVVEAFDVRSASKAEVQSLGAKFVEVEGAIEEISAGGYAVEQTEAFRQKQRQAVHDHAVKSDVIICTAQIPGKTAPVILLKPTIEQMQAGSIIIDLAASSGGNCELTQNNEVVNHGNVFIIGKSNYPSDMPNDASFMLGKNILNFLKLIIYENGNLNLDFSDDIVKGTCVTHNKEIVHTRVIEAMNNLKN